MRTRSLLAGRVLLEARRVLGLLVSCGRTRRWLMPERVGAISKAFIIYRGLVRKSIGSWSSLTNLRTVTYPGVSISRGLEP